MFQLLRIIGFVVVIFIHRTLVLTSASYCYTAPSACANGLEIRSPFWIDDGRFNCSGFPGFQIKCSVDGRPSINISNSLYYVLDIDSEKLTVMDADIDGHECPQPRRNFSIESSRFLLYDRDYNIRNMNIFYNCTIYPKYAVQHVPCLGGHKNGIFTVRSFAFLDDVIKNYEFNWSEYCEEVVVVPVTGNFEDYTEALKKGHRLSWSKPVDCEDCVQSGGRCWADNTTGVIHCKCRDGRYRVDEDCSRHYNYVADSGLSTSLRIITGVSAGIGALQVILLIIYRKYVYALYYLTCSIWREKFKNLTNVEVFLESYYGRLSLKRYRYADIKKMTNSFEHTLGQGGYGSVFKGKLPDGQLVAVKVLNASKGKGEDFINEVATIGKTNHVNVVNLLGFCSEGTKRALIYEFMPNGSLARFIYTEKRSSTVNPLGFEKLFQIALGTAKGLDYLHYGCNTRILHFDIKPHNILLDENFCPKISDFGLAKLCSTRESIVSMHDARGTMGYVAPEIYFGNVGGVSYKSDVYSYGKMVLEMIGGRMNSDATVENTSEIYFPHWIYKRLKRDFKVDGTDQIKIVVSGDKFEEDIAQKMIIVALWCVQAHPEDRPSMSKVVEMLEGSTEDLQMPPNPFPEAFSMSSSSST